MSENALSREQKQQIAVIARRWRSYKTRTVIAAIGGVFFAVAILGGYFVTTVKVFPMFSGWIPTVLGILGATAAIVTSVRRFTRNLSQEERELLRRVPEEEVRDYDTDAIEILQEVRKLTPNNELLRPSQPMADETLLRAAMQGGDVPQEQLLRASQQSAEGNDRGLKTREGQELRV